MSLSTLAQNLAAKGRHGDTMLVHMSPAEVKGLQSLAMAQGGSLTINPETGLPEAFKLKSLLPAIAGFALAPLTAGTSLAFLANPVTAGLTIGGIEALRTGDLGRGLMAGLGAYGGAGLGQALTSAGAQAAMTQEVGRQAAEQAAAQTATQSLATTPLYGTPAGAEAILQAGATPTTAAGTLNMMGQGVSNLAQPGGFSNLATGLGQAFPTTTSRVAAAAPLLMGASEAMAPQYDFAATQGGGGSDSVYGGPYVPSDRDVRFPGARPETSEFAFFTPSNPVPGYQPYTAARGGRVPSTSGLTALAGGRFLQGPGDGTSDSIPAVIGTKQPARLADGEFVVDARTVSELGNGSSKAGAQKLYAMMDRVHKARKKATRGKDSKADKHLPA